MDILPTLVDVIGMPSDTMLDRIDGASIKPLLAREIGQRSKLIPFHYKGSAALIDNNLKLVKLRKGEYQLFDLAVDKTESHDIAGEQTDAAKRLRIAIDAMVSSVANSQLGADYSEGKVTREGPHSRFWYAIPEYQPFLKGWADRPEYRDWVNRKQRAKNNERDKQTKKVKK